MAAHPQSFQGSIPCRADVCGVMAVALFWSGVLAILLCLTAAPALAQGAYSDAAYGEPGSIDPPGRVGWLSYLEGRVELGRDDDGDDAEPAELNWPISAGDRLFADQRGRFEVRIGSIALRGDGGSEIGIRTLDDERLRIEQVNGSVAISFQNREQAEGTELHTPYGRVDFALPGDYRIDVRRRAGQLVVTAFRGAAYVHADGLSVAVPEGRRAEVFAGGGDYLIRTARADDFDDWVGEREARDDRGRRQARAYVSPEMTGAEALAAYGAWSSVATYGVVWTPHVQPVGWAPYRHGRWAWVHPWGWTWIDAAPWGFAPFHYGRWVIINGRWSWIPGDHAFRPVFAPALVVWVGGSNWSLSFSSGPAVGWFPLGPREVYVPPRHFSHRYAYRVNRPSVSERTIETVVRLSDRPERLHEQRFRHRDEPRAVTVVPERTLSFGQPVQRQVLQLRDRREWRNAPVQVAPALRPAPVAERPRRAGRDEQRAERAERRERLDARDESRRDPRTQAREEVRDGRQWRDRAEQIAAPPGAQPPQAGRREPIEPREFRPRQPGPPPAVPGPQVRPLGPITPPPAGQPQSAVQPPAVQPQTVRPHTPAAIPATPPVVRPLQMMPRESAATGAAAGGSPAERVREQTRRLGERESAPAGPRAEASRREEPREGRRNETGGDRREARGPDERQRGAGQGEGEEQAPWGRKRVDPRRQDERP